MNGTTAKATRYAYVVQTARGSIQRGVLSGYGPDEVRQSLASRGHRLIGLSADKSTRSSSWWAACKANVERLTKQGSGSPRLGSAQAELMLQQLASMLESGLELAPSLRELSQQSHSAATRQVCLHVASRVEQGGSLHEALKSTGRFPPVACRLAEVGEQTGQLPATLVHAADFLQLRREAFGSLITALAYPILVAIAALAVAGYLVVYAIPKLAELLQTLGRELPAMTQRLVDIATFVQLHGITILVAAVACLLSGWLCTLWPAGRFQIDRAMLRVPLIGSLLRMSATHQLSSALALMLRSGVLLPDALAATTTLLRNRSLHDQITTARVHVAGGRDLAGSLAGSGFAPMLPSMAAVGEKTGDLPKALDHVARFYAARVDARIKQFARIVEPAIIVVVGGLVGYVYIAFFMALMSAGAT
ncbi:MAG: type II secretion system F family protein, partial [Planctomycetota bacterium]